MFGIYIHDTMAEPYAIEIIHGIKTVETRTRDVLGRFIGQRVAVVRTCAGRKAQVVGTVKLVGKTFLTEIELDLIRDQTCIPRGSKYDCHNKGKWCYTLAEPERTNNKLLSDYKIICRTMSWVEYEENGNE